MRILPRFTVWAVGLLAAGAALLSPAKGSADGNVSMLADKLRNASDFRLRVQAALSLGASNDPGAVKPLCDGLDDSNTAVRSAAAAAMGKLGNKSSLPCLKAKLPAESNASVASQIRRSVSQLETGSGVAPPSRPPDSSSKWYVAVGPTKTKGDRNTPETDRLVQDAARSALLATAGFSVAPVSENAAQASGVLSKFKGLKGYFLQPTVEEPKYDGSKLTIVVRITMFSYPSKALQGEVASKQTQSNTPSKDKESEDVLIKMAATRAVENFVKVAANTN